MEVIQTSKRKVIIGGQGFYSAHWGENPEATMREALALYRGGEKLAAIAKRYRVSRCTLQRLFWLLAPKRHRGGQQASHRARYQQRATAAAVIDVGEFLAREETA